MAPERRAAQAALSLTSPAGYCDGITLTCHRATERSADITDHQHVAEHVRSIERHLSAALESKRELWPADIISGICRALVSAHMAAAQSGLACLMILAA